MLLRLIERNLKLYLRDRMGVFFSFLSVLMVIIMYAVFLGASTLSGVRAAVGDVLYIDALVISWLMAGILFISTVTVPVSALEIFTRDRHSYVMYDFFAAPVDRRLMVLSYLISSIVITSVMSLLNLLAGQIYLFSLGHQLLNLIQLIQVLGLILLCSSVFSSLFFLVALILKSRNAFGSLGGIVGTLIGFFGGIYVPIGVMGTSVKTFVNILPFAQGVTLMRQAYMPQYLDAVFEKAPEQALMSYRNFYGLELELFSQNLSTLQALILLVVYGCVFYLISVLLIRKQKLA